MYPSQNIDKSVQEVFSYRPNKRDDIQIGWVPQLLDDKQRKYAITFRIMHKQLIFLEHICSFNSLQDALSI